MPPYSVSVGLTGPAQSLFSLPGVVALHGSASADLVEAVIANVKSGNEDGLLRELKRLKEEFHPTYENRANYDKLVNTFVDRMEVPPHHEATNAGTTPPE